ncbi:MAG: hypothetical protein NO515_02705 [Candidatus Methanomethylicia archaeon]|jgi:hypothetical protein|nr:hypothetical protein [Candidatus Methanomethylicia archaeon]MCQ5373919.1 hypothetical protein [Candidatus Methanomethylicia archaeon]
MQGDRKPKFAIISILLTFGAFILFVLATIVDPLSTYSNILMVAGLALLAASWGVYFIGGRSLQRTEVATENVITVIGCKGCDIREERPFSEGDYVFKELGPCKKCAGTSYIRAIYAIPTKKD